MVAQIAAKRDGSRKEHLFSCRMETACICVHPSFAHSRNYFDLCQDKKRMKINVWVQPDYYWKLLLFRLFIRTVTNAIITIGAITTIRPKESTGRTGGGRLR